MGRAAQAGLVYFLIVFAVGFGLGTLRVLVLMPSIGEIGAVLIELPVILAVSWAVARRLVDRYAVASGIGPRAIMGVLAFALLMLAEMLLGRFGFGRGLTEQVAAFGTLAGALGLLGQIGFAAIPLLIGPARA